MGLNLSAESAPDVNGFQLHNIGHSSASSLNCWAEAPCAWISQYLFFNKGKFSAAAKSGVLVEDAVVNVLARGFTADQATAMAMEAFNKFIALSTDEADRKRGEGIPEMIRLALSELNQYGTPEFDKDATSDIKQKKVDVKCKGDGWTLPIIGYIDFHFPKSGVIVDLKTTTRMPSEMSPSHLRQQAIYQQAFGNQAVKFLYVTPKKSQMFDCAGHKDTLAEIKTILNRQERFLRLGSSDLLRSLVPVNTGSFYWTGNEAVRKELYGI